MANKEDNKLNPMLEGFDNQPYTKEQALLHGEIASILGKYAYVGLSFTEINEVVGDIKMPDEVIVF